MRSIWNHVALYFRTFSHDDKRIPFNRWKLANRERAIKFDSPYCKKKILAEKWKAFKKLIYLSLDRCAIEHAIASLSPKGKTDKSFPHPPLPHNVVPMFDLHVDCFKVPGVDCLVLQRLPIWGQCLNNFVADCGSTLKWNGRHATNVSLFSIPITFLKVRSSSWNIRGSKRVCTVPS